MPRQTLLKVSELAEPTLDVEPPRWTAGPLTGFYVFLLAGCLVPLLIICHTGRSGESSGPWMWFAAVASFAALQYADLIAKGEPRLYALMTWLFVYLFLGIAPIIQLRTDHFPETTPGLDLDYLNRTAAIVVIGVVALAIGMRLRPGAAVQRGLPEINEAAVKWLTLFALPMNWWYISKVHSALFSTRDVYGALRAALWPDPTTGALVGAFSNIPLLTCTAASVIVYRRQKTSGWLILIVVEVASLIITVNPISSARIAFGTILLSLGAMFGWFKTSRRIRMSAVAVLLGLTLVFPYADAFRRAGEVQTAAASKGSPVEAMTHGDYDSMAQINNTAQYVAERGSTNGRQALGVALFWVPRKIWADKPLDTGKMIAQYRGYRFDNLSSPLWAEFYVNGSWLGLVGGFLLLGWVLRRMDDARTASKRIAIAGSILPFEMLMICRGSLLQAVAIVAMVIACSALITTRAPGIPSKS